MNCQQKQPKNVSIKCQKREPFRVTGKSKKLKRQLQLTENNNKKKPQKRSNFVGALLIVVSEGRPAETEK